MSSRMIFFKCIITIMAVLVSGCGSVDITQQGPEPLSLLELSPLDNEMNVAPIVDVVAVFSAPVTLAEGDSNLNEQTFFVRLDGGDKLDSVVTLSTPSDDENSDMGNTAVIRLKDLQPGTSYSIFVSGKLTGKNTGPLGVDVHSLFTVTQ